MKRTVIKKTITILAMLILLCAGCVPAQGGTAEVKVTFPLAVCDCAPKQMRNYFGTRYYLTSDHVLYGWGVNYAYSLGLSLPDQYVSDQPVKMAEDVMDVQGCGYATFILKSDKTLWVIGNYPDSETGENYRETFTKIADGVVEIKNCVSNTYCCYILKDTGDLYVLGSTNMFYFDEKPKMVLADSGVTRLNRYFCENEGDGVINEIITTQMITNYYFSYYRQDQVWYLNENKDGTFTAVKKHENVKIAAPYAFGYIDNENKFCINGYYITNDGNEMKPTDGKKVFADNIADLFGGEGGLFSYLTENGDLYVTGYGLTDMDTGNTVEFGAVKVANQVKQIFKTYVGFHLSTLYFLKEDDSLWAIGDNSMVIGDGSVPTAIYKDNRSVYSEMDLTVTDTIKAPVKILDNVAEFTSNYNVKMAITKDGKRYVWGQNVVAAVATSFGYAANETDPEHYITSKRGSSQEDCNKWLDERQTYRRKDIYLVPTLWEEVFGQPFPGDK